MKEIMKKWKKGLLIIIIGKNKGKLLIVIYFYFYNKKLINKFIINCFDFFH